MTSILLTMIKRQLLYVVICSFFVVIIYVCSTTHFHGTQLTHLCVVYIKMGVVVDFRVGAIVVSFDITFIYSSLKKLADFFSLPSTGAT